ncbi:hypothetical protein HII36_22365 [Nonomuraea sp. NN258]|uniref:hypothetical protein n=1 Tax=Nonomuraea antri TaxID=2730852 RepID=UPI0015696FD3|nr:hypothetical protein [Nonomuraea antri]NRQ34561.1 hypothetical protein [Nonomuraea antri]
MTTSGSAPSPVATSACELIRGDEVADDSGSRCDAEHLYAALVWLPAAGHEELARPVRAAVAMRTVPGAKNRPNPNARYGDNPCRPHDRHGAGAFAHGSRSGASSATAGWRW